MAGRRPQTSVAGSEIKNPPGASDMNEIDSTYSTIYEHETDFDNVLIGYDFRTLGARLKGPRVLELGCGRGTTTRLLAEQFPDLHVVDASQRCLDLAATNTPKTVQYFCAYFEEFEPPQSYDSIVIAHVLEHVNDPIGLLNRTKGWLRQGGSLHIVVPNARSLHRRIGVAMGLLASETSLNERDLALGHQRVYTHEHLRSDVLASGLRIVHHEGILLKILSNSQMEKLDRRLVDALHLVGRELPDCCADIYLHAVDD